MKIIFLIESEHFTIKNYNDLYVKNLSNFFEYEIWDCLNLNSQRKKQFKNIFVPNKIKESIIINSFNHFSSKIEKLNNKPIIITQYFTNKKIYEIIKNNGGYLLEINKVSFHLEMRRKSQIKVFIRSIIKNIYHNFLYIINKKKYNKKFPTLIDYNFSSLPYSEVKYKKFVPIHHIKYDDFIEQKKSPRICDKRYIVFVDIFLPHISDFIHKG